ncbi:MAG: hypothetical protein WCH65_04750 [bacterium]
MTEQSFGGVISVHESHDVSDEGSHVIATHIQSHNNGGVGILHVSVNGAHSELLVQANETLPNHKKPKVSTRVKSKCFFIRSYKTIKATITSLPFTMQRHSRESGNPPC